MAIPCRFSEVGCSALLASDGVAQHEREYAMNHVELFRTKYMSLEAENEHNKSAMSHAQSRCRAQEKENISLREAVAKMKEELVVLRQNANSNPMPTPAVHAAVIVPVPGATATATAQPQPQPGAVNGHMQADLLAQIDRLNEQHARDVSDIHALRLAVKDKDEWIREYIGTGAITVLPASAATVAAANAVAVATASVLRKAAPGSPALTPAGVVGTGAVARAQQSHAHAGVTSFVKWRMPAFTSAYTSHATPFNPITSGNRSTSPTPMDSPLSSNSFEPRSPRLGSMPPRPRSAEPLMSMDTNTDADAPVFPQRPRAGSTGSGSGSDSDDIDVDETSDPNYLPQLGYIRGGSQGSRFGMQYLCPMVWKNKAEKLIERYRKGPDADGETA